ncbi:P-loop containing nucleoside triphosphate hydrolase protein [Ephemerocybe angulata]|uniref:P-loop containing nucleoside triphosphate hydrolase protein n=1 Tax=Ephemerocybe angulata TaxID=980116 RepID=A0A8H6IK45_9AGAR|nr:P-loop containing nucleoside triphosphate hydrolase protein [Tulosesus angulatus]
MAWLTSLLAFTVPTCDSFARALLESTRNLRCGIRSGGREVLAGAVDGGGMQREPSRGSACDLRKGYTKGVVADGDCRRETRLGGGICHRGGAPQLLVGSVWTKQHQRAELSVGTDLKFPPGLPGRRERRRNRFPLLPTPLQLKMSTSGLKAIAPVPTAADFLDIVLSKTQRKTPTVIHKNFKISRIRNFYMRKVKFCQDCFDEKLGAILTEFPMLDDLHPFLSSLMNVLYDKNHYKLALGQLRTARHLIDHVAKDYCRLLKFGDSLYRCKQLKKAALGRTPLAYLEQVRQHISRLPAIDPNTRTLLVCGYPNVGKSSFINKVTRADVDVQPYAFTTKSLFVGHLDYKYLRWQVIDTPGILDHPLEEMNTIEMQSITAMAHLKSAILYFMDLSEQCGYTVEAQCKLFHSIKPLFATKPTVLVLNKIDVMKLEELHPDNRALVQEIIDTEGVICVQTSCATEEGVMDLKNKACDALLAHRVDLKMKGSKITSVANRIHVAQPKPRDDVVRAPFIPDAVKNRKKPRLLRDEELEQGTPVNKARRGDG